jgi:hypothetical protein
VRVFVFLAWREGITTVALEKNKFFFELLSVFVLEGYQLCNDAANTPIVDLGGVLVLLQDELRWPVPT